MKKIGSLLLVLVLLSCNEEEVGIKPGTWRVALDVKNGKELPFSMDWSEDNVLTMYNAEETIEVTDVRMFGEDSITIQAPVFEGIFKGTYTSEKISGDWIKPSLDRIVPFTMVHGDPDRFKPVADATVQVDGVWETVFSPEVEEDRYIAKGIFEQNGNEVTGTFRTTTGDYRYLQGVMDGDSLKLSTFDGAHAFLFEAKVTDSTYNGVFYSGNHWEEPFTGKRNADYELPDANTLTFLKEGYDKFTFAFPDTSGDTLSLEDERFQDKVVVVQIMGTWCPNCLDETRYYTDYLNNNPHEDLKFVSLAFEYAPTTERAVASIERLRNTVGVPYPILLAQVGTSSKQKANEKLPMLNHVLSYPTTIFIDKEGAVRKIHTGFNGPATGEKYVAFKSEFESFVAQLLAEESE